MNGLEDLKLDLKEIKLKLEKLNDEVSMKSNIKDVCALVDLKANVDDVEKNFDSIYKEIQNNCTSRQALDQILLDQKFINESLCALNCIGKWVWHGGFTTGLNLGKSTINNNKSSFKMSAFERV